MLGADTSLFPDEDPAVLLAEAICDVERWRADGLRLLSVLDPAYPERLRTVHDRPALLFLAGDVQLLHAPRAIAIVGTRRPSTDGLTAAVALASALSEAGHVVVSGLAAGIDAAAHRAAVDAHGRTIAVIGTGHAHVYPPPHATLQADLARHQAVVSPFWPDAEPTADRFRRRNGVMSGLSVGTVIVEASQRSGTRVQARLALAHGRPVFLRRQLLTQPWACELAARPGVHVVDTAEDLLATLERIQDDGPLTGPWR